MFSTIYLHCWYGFFMMVFASDVELYLSIQIKIFKRLWERQKKGWLLILDRHMYIESKKYIFCDTCFSYDLTIIEEFVWTLGPFFLSWSRYLTLITNVDCWVIIFTLCHKKIIGYLFVGKSSNTPIIFSLSLMKPFDYIIFRCKPSILVFIAIHVLLWLLVNSQWLWATFPTLY